MTNHARGRSVSIRIERTSGSSSFISLAAIVNQWRTRRKACLALAAMLICVPLVLATSNPSGALPRRPPASTSCWAATGVTVNIVRQPRRRYRASQRPPRLRSPILPSPRPRRPGRPRRPRPDDDDHDTRDLFAYRHHTTTPVATTTTTVATSTTTQPSRTTTTTTAAPVTTTAP